MSNIGKTFCDEDHNNINDGGSHIIFFDPKVHVKFHAEYLNNIRENSNVISNLHFCISILVLFWYLTCQG